MRPKRSHQPRKRFGQNFLQDPAVVQKILTAIHPKPAEHLVEIGPGLGVLTKPLLALVDHLDVIEIDRDLARELEVQFGHTQKLSIHTQDALKFDFNTLAIAHPNKKFRIIGNLPYNISTPLIFHLLNSAALIEDMHFMLQKEVVDRLCAKPNHKTYGRLSIMAQYYCTIVPVLSVPPNAFYPKPKVQSAFVRLTPHPILPHPAKNLALFQTLTRIAFTQRRKTIANALKSYLNPEDFLALNLNSTLRPETLSLADFVQISNYCDQKLNDHPENTA